MYNLAMTKTTKQTAAIFGLGLLLRVWGIASRPIWYDEAFAILFAKAGFKGIISGSLSLDAGGNAADIHPPGYYSILSSWFSLISDSVISGRVLSILFGMLTLWVVFVLCRTLFDERTAQWGLLFVAIQPFHVHYSQEIRMYAMMTVFLIGVAYTLHQAIRTNQLRWWTGYALLTALAQYTQNVAVLTLIPLVFTPLFYKDWKSFWRAGLASLTGVLLYLPWLLQLPAQFAKIQNAYWTTTPDAGRIFSTLLVYVVSLPLTKIQLPISLFLIIFILVIASWHTYKIVKSSTTDGINGLWLAYMAFAPMILMFVISQWQSVYIERGLLAAGVFFALWVAWVVSWSGFHILNRNTLVVFVLVAAFIGNFQHQNYKGFPYGPYQSLNEFLYDKGNGDSVIVHSNKLSILPMFYLAPDLTQEFVADPPESASDTLALPTQEIIGVQESETIQAAVGDANEVWFIIFSKAVEEYQLAGEETHAHLAWLDENFTQTYEQTWGDIVLYLFVK